MQYCVTRVRISSTGDIEEIEWGALDSRPLVLIADPIQSGPTEVINLIRRGRLVWAAVQTPFGLALGSLLCVGESESGGETLAIAPGGKLHSLQNITITT